MSWTNQKAIFIVQCRVLRRESRWCDEVRYAKRRLSHVLMSRTYSSDSLISFVARDTRYPMKVLRMKTSIKLYWLDIACCARTSRWYVGGIMDAASKLPTWGSFSCNRKMLPDTIALRRSVNYTTISIFYDAPDENKSLTKWLKFIKIIDISTILAIYFYQEQKVI